MILAEFELSEDDRKHITGLDDHPSQKRAEYLNRKYALVGDQNMGVDRHCNGVRCWVFRDVETEKLYGVIGIWDGYSVHFPTNSSRRGPFEVKLKEVTEKRFFHADDTAILTD
jgi:hypothetical protein